MIVSMIAALGRNRVIGRTGELPWHLPADLKFFQEKTLGHPVIMGRKTFESMGRPLPKRRNIVVTRKAGRQIQGSEVATSLESALTLVRGEDEVFIIGGAEIYRLGLAHADRMYLTRIHAEFAGDTFFPEFDEREWKVVEQVDRPPDDVNPYAMSFVTYQRRKQPAKPTG